MLVALLPIQAAEHWALVRDHINDSLPPVADYGPLDMNNILYGLMIGAAVCWIVTNEKREILGFIVTTTMRDISGVKSLWIYCSVILRNAPAIYWTEGIETLKIYARDKNCSKIGLFTNSEKIVTLLKEAGCEASTYVSYRL